jgi:hypothetical protein
MAIEPIGIQSLFAAAWENRGKLLYPFLPFLFVPVLAATLAVSKYSGGLTYFPSDRPAALHLPIRIGRDLGAGSLQATQATLLLIPSGTEEFFLSNRGSGIETAWFSLPIEQSAANRDRLQLDSEGLDVGNLRGVQYPLAVVVAGVHSESIDPLARPSQQLARLELATPDSTWAVLLVLGAAVFAFGASVGFMKDGAVVE